MQRKIFTTLITLCCTIVIFATEAFSADYLISLDEHDRDISCPYNNTGGNRGALNLESGNIVWNQNSSYTATIPSGKTWGGMWHGLISRDTDKIPLDFNAIFGSYIKSEYQGRIVEAQIVVDSAAIVSPNAVLKCELKDINGNLVYSWTWSKAEFSGGYPKTLIKALNPANIGKVAVFTWFLDNAAQGDSITVNSIRFKAECPAVSTEEQAFYWTYSWLMANYNPDTGMVRDSSVADYENVSATAKTAKITYYAYKKGYISRENAESVITKIAATLINNVPRGPAGKNTLWPHFTINGGTAIAPDSEWSSLDTVIAASDMIAALQMIGDPQNQIVFFENFLKGINGNGLLTDGYFSHGYSYAGDSLSARWSGFGMETIGINWAYASATGNVAKMDSPPTDNGSGFIDNAHFPMVFSGCDRWGNNWDTYRNNAASTQINWYCNQNKNDFFCNAGLFGLSAAETPNCPSSYAAYGTGGKNPVNDGDGVIVLHYAGMIADIKPTEAKHVWEVLRDRSAPFLDDRIVISPLNNMESMFVDKNTGKLTINHLKGSWNLALQAEGWAMADSAMKSELKNAVLNNNFLKNGRKLLSTGPKPNFTPSACYGYDNLKVTFTNATTTPCDPIGTWEWDFGNGNSSVDENPPEQTYSTGVYSVRLTVTEDDGDVNSYVENILVCDSSKSFPCGDLDCSGNVDLKDAIIGLRVVTDIKTCFFPEGDTDGDNKIEMSDVIYILQIVSGLRDLKICKSACPPPLVLEGELPVSATNAQVMSRSGASNLRTLLMKPGHEAVYQTTLQTTAQYQFNVRYSNDGPGTSLENVELIIDGNSVGTFTAEDTRAGMAPGDGWNNFRESPSVGSIILGPGQHTFKLKVNSGDTYGVEIDKITCICSFP